MTDVLARACFKKMDAHDDGQSFFLIMMSPIHRILQFSILDQFVLGLYLCEFCVFAFLTQFVHLAASSTPVAGWTAPAISSCCTSPTPSKSAPSWYESLTLSFYLPVTMLAFSSEAGLGVCCQLTDFDMQTIAVCCRCCCWQVIGHERLFNDLKEDPALRLLKPNVVRLQKSGGVCARLTFIVE
jgi:hypothetical protein